MPLTSLIKTYPEPVQLTSPETVCKEMADLKDSLKEVFVVFHLNTANLIISREIVSIGILNACIIHPREIFRTAIMRNANSIVVAHNHPSGELEPSTEDVKITMQLKKAGDIIGIKLLDHIIVGPRDDVYYSFNDKNKM